MPGSLVLRTVATAHVLDKCGALVHAWEAGMDGWGADDEVDGTQGHPRQAPTSAVHNQKRRTPQKGGGREKKKVQHMTWVAASTKGVSHLKRKRGQGHKRTLSQNGPESTRGIIRKLEICDLATVE